MNRRIILLNAVLLVLAGWLFWMLRSKWVEASRHERAVLNSSPRVGKMPVPQPVPPPRQVTAAEYSDVVQHTMFAKDRNPNVPLEPPPAPPPLPPPPPMPDLPAYYGEMNFGDPVVVLRLPKESQKSYHAGDQVGPFQLVSFNREKIVFDWNGKLVERAPDQLKEKVPVKEAAAPGQAPAPVSSNNGGSARSIGGPSDQPKLSDVLGKDNGAGIRQCVAGDKSPPGTIADGYKKVITTNMFGETCMWQLVNP